MNKFKIGDIIIGNKNASCYGITRSGVKCKVVGIGSEYIKVIVIGQNKDEIYPVNSNYFDLVKPKGPYLSNQGTPINV